MLGTRGVRLGVIKPGLYAMQVRALMEAALDRVAAGGHPVVEIMIPLTVSREEMALARTWVEAAIAEARAAASVPGLGSPSGPAKSARAPRPRTGSLEVLIGTMIETPRAALRAGEIAEVADFFSFGTNDLTQMTFGFSRDDVEGRMMSAYLEQGLLKNNPFEVVDPDGVGELVRLGVERGRATRPDAEGRGVRRARRRPRVDRHLRQGRPRLRELLALPGPHRQAGRRPGRPGRPHTGPPAGQGGAEAGRQGQGQGQAVAGPPGRAEPPVRRRRTAPAGDAVPSSSMGIPDEDVARVRAATDIVALIGEHAALKRQGRRWVGLCPFHGEKTPSFSVNADEGFYYCFGCQAKGDAISFVRAIEHLDFVDAVRRLADKAGITIREDAGSGRDSQRRKVFLDAMEQATEWYHQRLLVGADAGQARDYLRSRGLRRRGGPPLPARVGRPTPGTSCARGSA